jgi:hypothetical protein
MGWPFITIILRTQVEAIPWDEDCGVQQKFKQK